MTRTSIITASVGGTMLVALLATHIARSPDAERPTPPSAARARLADSVAAVGERILAVRANRVRAARRTLRRDVEAALWELGRDPKTAVFLAEVVLRSGRGWCGAVAVREASGSPRQWRFVVVDDRVTLATEEQVLRLRHELTDVQRAAFDDCGQPRDDGGAAQFVRALSPSPLVPPPPIPCVRGPRHLGPRDRLCDAADTDHAAQSTRAR